MGIPVEGVMQASIAMLQKQLYAIFTSPVGAIETVLANIDAHHAFQVSLEREGVLYAAGPMW